MSKNKMSSDYEEDIGYMKFHFTPTPTLSSEIKNVKKNFQVFSGREIIVSMWNVKCVTKLSYFHKSEIKKKYCSSDIVSRWK